MGITVKLKQDSVTAIDRHVINSSPLVDTILIIKLERREQQTLVKLYPNPSCRMKKFE